jgi:hypothetical protein
MSGVTSFGKVFTPEFVRLKTSVHDTCCMMVVTVPSKGEGAMAMFEC